MDKALAILTPVQLGRWNERIGPKFTGFRTGGGKPFGPPRVPRERAPGE